MLKKVYNPVVNTPHVSYSTIQAGHDYYWVNPYPRQPATAHVTTVENVAFVNLQEYTYGRSSREQPFFLLIVTTQGHPQFRHGDLDVAATRGSVTYYVEGEDYACVAPHWEAFTFHFHPSGAILDLLRMRGVTRGGTWPGVLGDDALAAYREIFTYPQLPDHLAQHRAALLVDATLLALVRHLEEEAHPPRAMRLYDLAQYLALNPAAPHTVAELAAMVNMSPSWFAHVFRAEFGQSVYAYLTRVRIELAKTMLTTTDLTAAVIGHQVGYPVPRHFYTVFKREVGMTPKVYRRSG